MSETEPQAPLYAQQWLYAEASVAAARKLEMEADPRFVSFYPPAGQPPAAIDDDGVDAAFLVAWATANAPPLPEDLKRAKGSFGAPVLGTF